MSQQARIFIIDDHPVVRDGLAAGLSGQDDLRVCGEADNAATALEQLAALDPDVIILDLSLGNDSGLDLIRRLRHRAPHAAILVHSMHDEILFAERTLRAGAHGYVHKGATRGELLGAIRAVHAGRTYLSPTLSERVIRRALSPSPSDGESPVEHLTDRELEVLTLIGNGLSTRAAAESLHLSVHTIDTHREKLKLKLDLDNGTELTRFAVQWVLENQ